MIEVKWDQAGLDEVERLALAELDRIAEDIAARADPPVDTGFLLNSAYVYSPRVNTFKETWDNGKYPNRIGMPVPRYRVFTPVPYTGDGATIGWAAIYAWFLEDHYSFIFNALGNYDD